MSSDLLAVEATALAHDTSNTVSDTFLTFSIGPQIFAIDVRNVREILDMQRISGLPNAPHDVVGMIDVRNQGIAIVDLADRLGMVLEDEKAGRIIVLEMGDPENRVPVGVIADKVLNVFEISPDGIEPAPATLSSWDPAVVQGVTRQNGALVILLVLGEIFQMDQGSHGGQDIFTFDELPQEMVT